MARIVLVGFNEAFGKELSQCLKNQHHATTVCARGDEAWMKDFATDLKLVMLNFTRNAPEDWEALKRISKAKTESAAGPMILCVANRYLGPKMELEIERRGARIVYVRELHTTN